MGQHYLITNIDKKESFKPEGGAKLMEFSWHGTDAVNYLLGLLAGRWKGDRVYVVGQDAEWGNVDPNYHAVLEDLLDETQCYKDDDECADSLYTRTASWPAPDLSPEVLTAGINVRYIYNHALGQFIDLTHLPIDKAWRNPNDQTVWVNKVAPLPLLLAMGNGFDSDDYEPVFGSGDYKSANKELVGAWCMTSQSIEVTQEERPDHETFFEFFPDFHEKDELILWTNEDEEPLIYKEEKEE